MSVLLRDGKFDVAILAGPRVKSVTRTEARRKRTIATAVQEGPGALTDADRMFLLTDGLALSQLHVQVWTSAAVHSEWFASSAPDHTDLDKVA